MKRNQIRDYPSAVSGDRSLLHRLTGTGRGCKKIILLCGAVLLLTSQTNPAKEYQVKAAFLYNFAQFVNWPQTSFPTEDAPIIIGVLGDDPFGTHLDNIIKDELIAGHPIAIRRFKGIGNVGECHILFISRKLKNELGPIFENLKSSNILTVGDVDNFINDGGMVRLFVNEGKIRIQINPAAAKNAELKISSKLLALADIVTKKE